MNISFFFQQFTLVLLLGLFQCQAWAFDQQKPEGISDHNWSSLQAAIEEAKLLPSDGIGGYFGYSVSLFGNRALIGAYGDDSNGNNSGSAYVFELSGGIWNETAKLTASDGAEDDNFGYSVSLFGDRALISAPYDNDNGTDSGSVYVFDLSGGSWNETTKLIAGDGTGTSSDNFGYSVSLSGDRALIGARYNGIKSGSAYVFDLGGGSWSETIKLTASDAANFDQFGHSVSLSGDRALISALYDDENGAYSGSAYVFDLSGGSWTETDKLIASDGFAEDLFGWSVSLSGDRALIGAYGDDDNGSASGSAYVFDYDGVSAWSESAKLTAGDGATNDAFGNSVSLSGDRALVGAYSDDDNVSASGSAYVFDLGGNGWVETIKLTASDGANFDQFGKSVSQSGDRALIGTSKSSAYVFKLLDDLIFRNGFEFVDLIFRDGFDGP